MQYFYSSVNNSRYIALLLYTFFKVTIFVTLRKWSLTLIFNVLHDSIARPVASKADLYCCIF